MPKIDLLPCPFCGGKAERVLCQYRNEYGSLIGFPFLAVKCKSCAAEIMDQEEQDGLEPDEMIEVAAKAWNTRASGWIPCSERMPEFGDIVLVYAHVSVSDEEYWDEQFTAIYIPKKMLLTLKDTEGMCWIGASSLNRPGDMISAETGFHFRCSEHVDTIRITHWMPLPNPPIPADKPCGGDENDKI